MKLSIKVDDREVRRALGGLRKQIPFATSLALNKTAFDVRKHLVFNVWRQQVSVRSKAFLGRGMRVNRADKRFLAAEVFLDETRISGKGANAVKQLIDGSPHFPYSSTHLAIPVGKGILTPTGRLSKRGRAMLNRNNPQTFVADLRGQGPAIWERVRGNRIRLLFVLERRVPTPRKFTFEQSARAHALRVWPRHARDAVRHAITTARF